MDIAQQEETPLLLEIRRAEAEKDRALCFRFLRNGPLEKWSNLSLLPGTALPHRGKVELCPSQALGLHPPVSGACTNQSFWDLLLFQQPNTVDFFFNSQKSFLLKFSWRWETDSNIITKNSASEELVTLPALPQQWPGAHPLNFSHRQPLPVLTVRV